MASFAASLHEWPRICTPAARDLVRSIVSSSTRPLSTKDIYHLAVGRTGIIPGSTEPASRLIPKRPLHYKSVVRGMKREPPPQPPHPSHPVRSINYLKNVVLPHLVSTKEVEKFCTKRTLSQAEIEQRLQTMSKSARKQQADLLSAPVNTWLWRLKPQVQKEQTSSAASSSEALTSAPVETKISVPSLGIPRLTSAAVGVGEDWSHLNKRRQRARKGKVQRDLKWMWTLQNARREAAKKELESSASTTAGAA
ncbi:hypothetical protein BV22DRAFT_1133921 [Leucogyrophana mollusca]|uniref:Uncharacterized protein n=1 Tax=Leucogyrophana mollusca TaxID=85980 RepID=A0ACB8B0F9_9AGAM|nr:hypothetical protein BV22DRAFT_1133921 [Leucogyrophana mollusca]